MGLFSRRHRSDRTDVLSGNVALDVVGESYRQDVLWSIVGGRGAASGGRVVHPITAVLMPEDDNEHDENAVCVKIDGQLVGYLRRETAAAYRPGILRIMKQTGALVALRGEVCGARDDDGTGSLGVFLHHDPADFGVSLRAPDIRIGYADHGVRTGASETDAYWRLQLTEADRPAIKKLHELLPSETDPVERHFMWAELEHRLYHARDLFAAALDEFDQACRSHDEEMATIRPALIAYFEGLPLLETYRQSCIRHAKAQQWADSEWWATRGLTVYADDALREEFVEDLTKRRNQAQAKQAAPPPPERKRPTIPRPPRPTAPAIEVLVCQRCSASFERVVTRGRKPSLCPDCRTAWPAI